MPKTFEDLNDHLVYVKASSRTDALKMRDSAQEITGQNKSVVIFFNKEYHLYLAPGYDPYQIRREIDAFMNKTDKSSTSNTDSDTLTVTTTTKTKSSKSKLKT